MLWIVELIRQGTPPSLGCKMVLANAVNYEAMYFLTDQEVLDAVAFYRRWWEGRKYPTFASAAAAIGSASGDVSLEVNGQVYIGSQASLDLSGVAGLTGLTIRGSAGAEILLQAPVVPFLQRCGHRAARRHGVGSAV